MISGLKEDRDLKNILKVLSPYYVVWKMIMQQKRKKSRMIVTFWFEHNDFIYLVGDKKKFFLSGALKITDLFGRY